MLAVLLLPAVVASAQTLKAGAPVPTDPTSGMALTTRTPTLTVQNAEGTYVSAVFIHRFEVYDAVRMTLARSGVVIQGNGMTQFGITTPLDYATTYWWRARAELDGADGPWSATFSFVTPDPPPPPSGPLSFTDISVVSGIGPSVLGGHGAMFADATDDGHPDLYFTMNFDVPQADLFFVNGGDSTFAELGAARGIADFGVGSHGAAFADLDNDGDYDLVNGATGEEGAPNNIFRNNGQGFFTDVTPASMATRAEATRGMVTFDMDRDGDLDIFAVSGFLGSDDPAGERNELYRNDGNLQFTAITSGAAYNAEAGQGVTDTDYDGDGDIDLIASNRTGRLAVLRNDGGVFTQVTAAALGIDRDAASGITMADIDTDGDQDMLLVDLDASDERVGYLYRNNGGGTFTRVQEFSSIEGFMGGFADLDNDQDLDLVFAGGRAGPCQSRRSLGPALWCHDSATAMIGYIKAVIFFEGLTATSGRNLTPIRPHSPPHRLATITDGVAGWLPGPTAANRRPARRRAVSRRSVEAPHELPQYHLHVDGRDRGLCLPKTSSPHYVHWALLRISRRPASITGHADRLSRTVHRVGLRPAEPGGAPD